MRIEMLGRFRIVLGDQTTAGADWQTRRAKELVALLALTEGRTLSSDQVIEQLWPQLGARAGAANLRKAAHHARRTLSDQAAVMLRSGRAELFPGRGVTIDVEDFTREGVPLRNAEPSAK